MLLVTYIESHASAVSLLESGEQRYIKAINNNSLLNYVTLVTKKYNKIRTTKKIENNNICIRTYVY